MWWRPLRQIINPFIFGIYLPWFHGLGIFWCKHLSCLLSPGLSSAPFLFWFRAIKTWIKMPWKTNHSMLICIINTCTMYHRAFLKLPITCLICINQNQYEASQVLSPVASSPLLLPLTLLMRAAVWDALTRSSSIHPFQTHSNPYTCSFFLIRMHQL